MQRFIARYIHEKPEKTYEVGLHIMNVENHLKKKVKEIMRRTTGMLEHGVFGHLSMNKQHVSAVKWRRKEKKRLGKS